MLVPHLHRCRSLEIQGLTIELANFIFPISDTGPLQRLEDLRIKLHCVSVSKESLFSHTIAAPYLVNLKLGGIFFITPSTKSLTELTLWDIPSLGWADLLTLFESYHHLEHLHIVSKITVDDPPSKPLILPRLLSLTTFDTRFDRYILTPKLEHLSCRYFDGELTWAARSLPPLQRLTLYYPWTSALEEWEPPLPLTSVHTLDLIRSGGTIYILNLLLSRSGESDTSFLFPSIRKLCLHHCHRFGSGDLPQHIFRVLDARPELVIEADRSDLVYGSFPRSNLDDVEARIVELDPETDATVESHEPW